MTTKRTTKKKLAVATEQTNTPVVKNTEEIIVELTDEIKRLHSILDVREEQLRRAESNIENYEDLLQSIEDQSWWEITKDKFMTFVYDKTSYFK